MRERLTDQNRVEDNTGLESYDVPLAKSGGGSINGSSVVDYVARDILIAAVTVLGLYVTLATVKYYALCSKLG